MSSLIIVLIAYYTRFYNEIMMAWLTREDVLMRLDEDSDSDFDGYLDETDEMHWRGCESDDDGGNVDGGHKSMDNGGNGDGNSGNSGNGDGNSGNSEVDI